MNCPTCKHPLMVLEFERVEVDHCVACGGVWLDAEEIELLFGEPHEAELFFNKLAPTQAEKSRKLRCPISNTPMQKGTVDTAHGAVTYDYSPHGLWFDRGELSQVLAAGVIESGSEPLVAWLREIFPMPEQAHG